MKITTMLMILAYNEDDVKKALRIYRMLTFDGGPKDTQEQNKMELGE